MKKIFLSLSIFLLAAACNATVSSPQPTKPQVVPPNPTVQNNYNLNTKTDVSDPGDEIINGTAYLSPNAGEGLSVKYTENANGQVYHPFQPLQNFIDSNTQILNKNNLTIQFSQIKVGDQLIVHISVGPAITAVMGGKGGIQFKIFIIKDLSR